MNKNFVTIIILVKEDYNIDMIRKFIIGINKANTSFVELFVIYTSDIVNKFIHDLNIDLPMTVIKNYKDLPDFYNLGLGNTKYLIDNNTTSEITRKNNHQVFVGRRANIIFK
jgi:hypothetical protein